MQLARTLVIGLLAACGGDGKGALPDAPGPGIDAQPPVDAGCPTTFAVDQAHGNDGDAGDCMAPWKTLTHALATATTGQSIALAPGMYGAAAGESPSVIVPAGVTLIGDEAGKGATTTIAGFHFAHTAGYSTAIELMDGATIAGVTIVNADPTTTDIRTDLWVYDQNGITVRNSNLSSPVDYGIWMEAGSHDATIDGNRLVGHKFNGLLFVQAGANTRVEHNVITGNKYGVEYDSNGGDLGGGPTGSAGDNTISCNTGNDIWTNTPSIAITAMNNHWDHLPPTTTTNFSLMDIQNGQSVPLDTTGATLATTPCP